MTMIYYEIIVNWCKYCINKDCKFYNEPVDVFQRAKLKFYKFDPNNLSKEEI